MRLIILFVGILIADTFTLGGLLPSDPDAADDVMTVFAILAGYAVILDLAKKS
jgi:hypothetical protein